MRLCSLSHVRMPFRVLSLLTNGLFLHGAVGMTMVHGTWSLPGLIECEMHCMSSVMWHPLRPGPLSQITLTFLMHCIPESAGARVLQGA